MFKNENCYLFNFYFYQYQDYAYAHEDREHYCQSTSIQLQSIHSTSITIQKYAYNHTLNQPLSHKALNANTPLISIAHIFPFSSLFHSLLHSGISVRKL